MAGVVALVGILGAIALNSGFASVLASAAAAVPAANSATTAEPGPAAATVGGGDMAAGRDIYLASCAACHGDQAQGTVNGPSLRDAGPALLDFMMRTGRMPLPQPNAPIQRRQPVLTADQVAAVVAFVGSLGGGGPAIPDVAVSGADLALGRSLFIANCAACHGAGGAGGAVGNGIIAPGLGRSEPIDVGEAVVAGPPPMPRFSFAPGDLNAIAAYVQDLRHPASPGGISLAGLGPVPEGFIAGLVGLVGLLIAARWIGASPRRAQADALPADHEASPVDES